MRKIILIFGLSVVFVSLCSADQYHYLAKKLSKGAEKLSNKKIAVLPLQYYDGRNSPGSTIVSEHLTTKIVEVGKLQVVERTLLNKIMEEMKLGKSGIIDHETTKELGKVLGVEAIVTGVLIEELKEGQKAEEVNINTRLIKIETGDILVAATKKVKKTWEDEPASISESVSASEIEKTPIAKTKPSAIDINSDISPEPEVIKIGPKQDEPVEDTSLLVPLQLKQSHRSLLDGHFRNALDKAKNVFHNNQNKPFIAAHALFIIGKVHESEGHFGSARGAYIKIIKDYPFNKNVVRRAQRRLRYLDQHIGRR